MFANPLSKLWRPSLTLAQSAARGCLLGAFAGDAAGATLEFLGRTPTEQEVTQALAMTGGGHFQLAPGQITDDGELGICLARALLSSKGFNIDVIAQNYRSWFESPPFDVGSATWNAIGARHIKGKGLAETMRESALARNPESKANGALMRCMPLGIWSAGVSEMAAAELACQDAMLSHPNISCQYACAAYVLAIRHLMHNPNDSIGAVNASRSVLGATEAAEVAGWLDDAIEGRLPAAHPQAGFVRIAFTHSFAHLVRKTPWREAIRFVLSIGGDTDTNACIAGGLLGALHGINDIPEKMYQAVLRCETRKGIERPDWLSTRSALDMADGLLPESLRKHAPSIT